MKKSRIFLLVILLLNFGLAIAFSEFVENLSVNGDADLRIPSDFRVSKLVVFSQDDGVVKKSNYNVKSTKMNVSFPNNGSSITYQVTITNKNSMMFVLESINVLNYSNTNVSYSINGLTVGETYSGSSLTFSITLTSNVSNQNVNLELEYNFVPKTIKWDYGYEGKERPFPVPYNGVYKIELWGARGGASGSYVGGSGAYTSGIITLTTDRTLYIHVGAIGSAGISSGGAAVYNGGGKGGDYYSNYLSAGGGGATDVRLTSGSWDNVNSLRSRIMVAAGGGGALSPYDSSDGNAGGGLTGHSAATGYAAATGGEQTTYGVCPQTSVRNGEFGKGGSGNTSAGGAGGGSGYYGGAAGWGTGGGGGSSYISGHTGCVAIKSQSDSSAKSGCSSGTTDNSCSIHYSGLKFTDTVMIDGKGNAWTNVMGGTSLMPNPSGGNYASGKGHYAEGHIRITLIAFN